MGRHSIPDPEDPTGEEQHEEPQTQRFDRSEDPEADYRPGSSEPKYSDPEYRDSEPGYRRGDSGETDFEQPDPDAFTFDDPDYRQVEFEDLEPVGSFDLQRVG